MPLILAEDDLGSEQVEVFPRLGAEVLSVFPLNLCQFAYPKHQKGCLVWQPF